MAMPGTSIPIRVVKVLGTSDALPTIRRIAEAASQSMYGGTPVQLNSSGFVVACPTINAATVLIAGMCEEGGSNLTTAGVAKVTTEGTVQNQSNAQIIPIGVKPNDGTIGLNQAIDTNLFMGTLTNSSTGSHTLAQSDIGATYGLTKDTNSYWGLDANITAAASGACCIVTELVDAIGTANGKVIFKIARAFQQLSN